jgi:hypothetical protein
MGDGFFSFFFRLAFRMGLSNAFYSGGSFPAAIGNSSAAAPKTNQSGGPPG